MGIRELRSSDLVLLEYIHKRDYPELDFPFALDLMAAFVIENEKNELVMGGGLQPTAEVLLTTDKTKSRIQIGKALVEAKKYVEYAGRLYKLQELTAFVGDEEYAKHLIQHGFEERDEKALRIKL